jgi:hypothetical protein
LLQLGVKGLGEVFGTKRLLHRHLRVCESPAEVCQAIEWMAVVAGRSLSPGGAELSPGDAMRLAAEKMRIDLAAYQARAVEWWKFNPWTIALAEGNKRPVGCTIVLPLSDNGRDTLLEGRAMSYEIAPSEMQKPSECLLFEAIVERPRDMGAEASNMKSVTRSLFVSLLAQAGIFSHQLPRSRTESLQFLSFGATPTNKKRLKGFGFKDTDRFMKGTEIEFFVKTLSPKSPRGDDWQLLPFMWHFGEILDPVPDT